MCATAARSERISSVSSRESKSSTARMTATGLPFFVTVTRSCVPATSSITWLKWALTAANDSVDMTMILVTEPRPVKELFSEWMATRRGSNVAVGGSTTGSEPPAGRHVKAPRSRAMLLYRGFEGPRPRAVLVDDRGFSGPGERECQVAVSSLRALREYAVDLESSLDHRRVGECRNAVDRQDPGEHASLTVQPHHGQSPPVDVRFGRTSAHQTLSSAADVMGVDERGVDGMAAVSPGTGTVGATSHRAPGRRSACGKTAAGNHPRDVPGRREGPAGR